MTALGTSAVWQLSRLCRWLDSLVGRIARCQPIFGDGQPNHVLVNAYEAGQGIHSHQDGPVYFPGVCVLSLGGSAMMCFYRKLAEGTQQLPAAMLHQAAAKSEREFEKTGSAGGFDPRPCAEVLLQPRSLLVFEEEAYTECSHGIETVSFRSCSRTTAYFRIDQTLSTCRHMMNN